MADAGWYPDPQNPNSEQYFDGASWTGQRRYGQPMSGGQQYGQQYGQQPAWQAAPPAGSAGWAPPAAWAPPPPVKRKRRRAPLIIGAVAVLAIAGGLVTWLAWPDDQPSLTYHGKSIVSASAVLKKAESSLHDLVSKRHGSENDRTRCYFAQPDKPGTGAKRTDIDQKLRCGPVLFVDGDRTRPYLPVPLTSSPSGGKVTLTAQPSLDGLEPESLEPGLTLVRPDGSKAPDGDGGLRVPTPPAAQSNVLTTASLGTASAPPALDHAVMVGKSTKVTVDAAGAITRYGQGDDARSAPSGQKLIAFRLTYGSGELSGTESAPAQVVVDGGTPRALPETSGSDQWVVLAAPSASKPVVQLADGGFTQTLALPSGAPGAGNIAVLSRKHRTGYVGATVAVPIHLSNGNGSADVTFRATATFSSLDFWVPGHSTQHASDTAHAILSVRLNYTDSASPGNTYGFDPQLLRLQLPKGGTVPARNVATGNKIFDVFEVPAGFSTGSLQITGSERVGGVNLRVASTRSFAIRIAAG